ncbi:MAG: cation:proton antiporter [Propionibacteriales bacterium]|nr:cation:proton antiporter [Propionibacteriales bacterium]
MKDVEPFGLIVLVIAGFGVLAVLSNRISERVQIPAPAIFLVCAAGASHFQPHLSDLSETTVERVVTIAVATILFDGGMHIGWPRIRQAIGPILAVGVVGTFLTAAAVAVLAHVAFGFEWWVALLLGTAVAPTDPAVVFSVLGRREISGRSGTILEGESGANDPVGIALMGSLLAAGALSAGSATGVAAEFVVQMTVGTLVGLLGAKGLLWFMRRIALPSEALYSLRTLAGGFAIFGLATVAQGSGFLAIFVAGIVLGDARAPYKGEIERFVSALASLGEIVAFVVLGLTVDVAALAQDEVWLVGLVIAAALGFFIRPLLVGLVMVPFRLGGHERAFILWAGLKGAVPILLGTFLLSADVPEGQRVYGIIVVVTIFSVVVQGGLVPTVARRLKVPMRTLEPEPWSVAVRLRDEPEGVHRHRVEPGSSADGSTIEDLPVSSDDVWISFVIRSGEIVPVRGHTILSPEDDVVVLADPRRREELTTVFSNPRTQNPEAKPPPPIA